jgi:hypothetical protein
MKVSKNLHESYDVKIGVLQLNHCERMIGFKAGLVQLPRSGLLEQRHEPDRVPCGPLRVMPGVICNEIEGPVEWGQVCL